MNNDYTLLIKDKNKKLFIPIKALDTNHAQAQAQDIGKSLYAEELELIYGAYKNSEISNLFEKLAFNTYDQNTCDLWQGTTANKYPCIYIFAKRFYVKDVILRYLDIPKERLTAKSRCKNRQCTNPYHFEYHGTKNSKLTCGDIKLLLAYRGQGTGVNQIAEALNVHRSTIYRKLKNERLSSGSANHSRS